MSRVAVATSLTAAVAGPALLAPAAMADSWVTGCHVYSAMPTSVCVSAYTGGKDVGTRTQWVGAVRVEQRGLVADGGVKVQEAWGDGFYYRKDFAYGTPRAVTGWTVNRWVRSGTYVCGAITNPWGTRRIACIAIRV